MAVSYAIGDMSMNSLQGGLEVTSSSNNGTITVTAKLFVRRTSYYSGTTMSSRVNGTVNIDGTTSSGTFGPSITASTDWHGSYITCTKQFTGAARNITVSWSTSDQISPYRFSGSGSGTFAVPAGYTAPTGIAVSVSSVTDTSATMKVSISSYGNPSSTNGRYIEAAICSTSSYGAEPRRYKAANNVTSSSITVNNSSTGTLTIASNTKYYYGAYASNTQLSTQTIGGTFATLAATPTGKYSSQSYLTAKTVKANITYTSSAGGNANTRYIEYRYSTNGGSSYSAWLRYGTISGTSGTISLSGLPTSSSIRVQLRVATSAGTSGVATVSFSSLATHANPVFKDFSYADTIAEATALTGSDQTLIQGVSKPKVTISASQQATTGDSQTISGYTASLSGRTASISYSSSAATSATLNTPLNSGSQALTVIATDSLKSQTSVSKSVTIYPYSTPTLNLSASRANNYEAETTIKVSGAYAPIIVDDTAKNTLTFRYRTKQTSTTEWSEWTSREVTVDTEKSTYKVADFTISLDNTVVWDIQAEITDAFNTTNAQVSVNVGQPLFYIGTDGRVSIGKLAETALTKGNSGQLEVFGDIISSSALKGASLNITGNSATVNSKNVATLPITSDNIDWATFGSGAMKTVFCNTSASELAYTTYTLNSGNTLSIRFSNGGQFTGALSVPNTVKMVKVYNVLSFSPSWDGNYMGVNYVRCTTANQCWAYYWGIFSGIVYNPTKSDLAAPDNNIVSVFPILSNVAIITVEYTCLRVLGVAKIFLTGSIMCSGSSTSGMFNIEANITDNTTIPSIFTRGTGNGIVTNVQSIIEIYEQT